jgi:two-component system capsular synthesis sensor histidine kinase RcsC
MLARELVEAVHARALPCDVIVVASHLGPDDARLYAAVKVDCVLTKPVMLADLRRSLTRIARRRGIGVLVGAMNERCVVGKARATADMSGR